MENLPLTSGVSSGGSQFYGMGNPQHEVPSSGGNIYNPHMNNPYHVTFSSQAASAGMVPLQPFMNQLGGGYYPTVRAMVYTRTLVGPQSLKPNISWEHGLRHRNPDSLFWPR
jgi:hypothetical protein